MLIKRAPSVWKYRELLPVKSKRHIVTLGEGNPLLKASDLAKKVGLRNLYLKDEDEKSRPDRYIKDFFPT